jgi:hypothetical protein
MEGLPLSVRLLLHLLATIEPHRQPLRDDVRWARIQLECWRARKERP